MALSLLNGPSSYFTVPLVIIVLGLAVPSKCIQSAPGYNIHTLYNTKVNSDLSMRGLKQTPNLWFGPRLGRRKRNEDENSSNVYKHVAYKISDEESPWSVVPRKEDIWPKIEYNPRLGRKLDEDGNAYNKFTPKLGRRHELLARLYYMQVSK